MASPFKIDRDNVTTLPALPTPISDPPTDAQVPGLEIEQEKKVTFHSPVPTANLGFTPPVTWSKGKKISSAYHGIYSKHTALPSGEAHPEDKALNQTDNTSAGEFVDPAENKPVTNKNLHNEAWKLTHRIRSTTVDTISGPG